MGFELGDSSFLFKKSCFTWHWSYSKDMIMNLIKCEPPLPLKNNNNNNNNKRWTALKI